jgi:hypothetical protein
MAIKFAAFQVSLQRPVIPTVCLHINTALDAIRGADGLQYYLDAPDNENDPLRVNEIGGPRHSIAGVRGSYLDSACIALRMAAYKIGQTPVDPAAVRLSLSCARCDVMGALGIERFRRRPTRAAIT